MGVVTNSRYLVPYTHPPGERERERTKMKDKRQLLRRNKWTDKNEARDTCTSTCNGNLTLLHTCN